MQYIIRGVVLEFDSEEDARQFARELLNAATFDLSRCIVAV